MRNYKHVEIHNLDQWRGPSDQQNESDNFDPLIVPFIEELDRVGAEVLRINAEYCRWAWKQWEMRYVYQNLGDVYQKRVCDIGGYLNPLLRLLAKKGAICYMYDVILPEEALISQLSYNNLINYEQQDVCSLNCSDDTFDVVYSISTLEHVANKRSAISEMVRVTKPGGLVMCTCDVCSHDMDYQLEDPFFQDIPLNEGAIEDLLGISIRLPDKHQCWAFWKKESVYMSLYDRWPGWKFPFQREYTALGFVLRVKSNTPRQRKTGYSLGSVVTFDSRHSAHDHLVYGFYNVELYGGRFTRKAARLKLSYDAQQHRYFYVRGEYASLGRTANRLRIAVGDYNVVNIPLISQDRILDIYVEVPSDLASGTVPVDFEVEDVTTAGGADERLLGFLLHECGFIQSVLPHPFKKPHRNLALLHAIGMSITKVMPTPIKKVLEAIYHAFWK